MKSKNVLLGSALVLIVLGAFLLLQPSTTDSQVCESQGNITGWAWSDTIGWVSLSSADPTPCSVVPYGLTVSNGVITGYAWSENIGWIQFGGLSGFPVGTSTVSSNAQVQGSNVVGWARATSYSDSESGGWDGWISLYGQGYGLSIINNAIVGYAWGDANVGWLDFSANYPCAETVGNFCDGEISKYRDLSCNVTTIEACVSPYSCVADAGTCIAPVDPDGMLTVSPLFVPSQSEVTISWTTEDAASCTVTGTNGFSANGTTGNTTSTVNTTTVFTLTCTGEDDSVFTDEETVRVSPRWKEK